MCWDAACRSARERHRHQGLCLIIRILSFYHFNLLINPWKEYLLGCGERMKLFHLGAPGAFHQ